MFVLTHDCFQTYVVGVRENSNILFEGNNCSGFHQGIETEGSDLFHSWILRNNIFGPDGLGASGYGFINHGLDNMYIYNNTFYDLLLRGIYACTSTENACDAEARLSRLCDDQNNIFQDMDRAYSYEAAGTHSGDAKTTVRLHPDSSASRVRATDIKGPEFWIRLYTTTGCSLPRTVSTRRVADDNRVCNGEGYSFTVLDAGTSPTAGCCTGDVIQLQGQTTTRTITDILERHHGQRLCIVDPRRWGCTRLQRCGPRHGAYESTSREAWACTLSPLGTGNQTMNPCGCGLRTGRKHSATDERERTRG